MILFDVIGAVVAVAVAVQFAVVSLLPFRRRHADRRANQLPARSEADGKIASAESLADTEEAKYCAPTNKRYKKQFG